MKLGKTAVYPLSSPVLHPESEESKKARNKKKQRLHQRGNFKTGPEVAGGESDLKKHRLGRDGFVLDLKRGRPSQAKKKSKRRAPKGGDHQVPFARGKSQEKSSRGAGGADVPAATL